MLLVSVLIISLNGCGGGGGTANLAANGSGSPLQSITISPANPQLAVYTSQQLTATGIYADNTTQDLTSSVEWSSSAADVASGIEEARFTGLYSSGSSATKPGHVTAVQWGKAKITAKVGDVTGSTVVTVTTATIVSLAITPANLSTAPSSTQQFIATGTFSDNTKQDLTTDVTWNSSVAGVAAISNLAGSNGLATSGTEGTTTITATFMGVSASTALIVTTVVGQVNLVWEAPTTNPDGTPLAGLAGYKIHYGTSSGNYTTTVDVGNVTAYALNNLPAGTYYIVTTAYYTSGGESGYSNEVIKMIQ